MAGPYDFDFKDSGGDGAYRLTGFPTQGGMENLNFGNMLAGMGVSMPEARGGNPNPSAWTRVADALHGASNQLDYTNPKQNEAEQLYQFYLRAGQDQAKAIPPEFLPIDNSAANLAYQFALRRASEDREGGRFNEDRSFSPVRPPNTNPALRDAQHGLVGQMAVRDHPFLGRLYAPAVVGSYNATKLVGQSPWVQATNPWLPKFLDWIGDQILDSGPNSITKASPPSWSAVKWGLRPFWGQN